MNIHSNTSFKFEIPVLAGWLSEHCCEKVNRSSEGIAVLWDTKFDDSCQKKLQTLSMSHKFHFSKPVCSIQSLISQCCPQNIFLIVFLQVQCPLYWEIKWFGKENTRHLWQNCRWNQNPSSLNLCVAKKIIIITIQLDLKLDLNVGFKIIEVEQESLMQWSNTRLRS